MEKKIEDISEMELESLCYRQIMLLEQIKNNIQVIQQELKRRADQNQKNKETDNV